MAVAIAAIAALVWGALSLAARLVGEAYIEAFIAGFGVSAFTSRR